MAVNFYKWPGRGRNFWWDVDDYPASIVNDHKRNGLYRMGMGLYGNDLLPPIPHHGFLLHPKILSALKPSGLSEVKNEGDRFQVMLNVKHFKPEEVEVKIVDNCVVVHGKHEEKSDEHGFIEREFTRRYVLPEGIEADTIKCKWSLNGILTIETPQKVIPPPPPPPSNERVIPIVVRQRDEDGKNQKY